MKLTDLIKEANKKPIYKGDILKVRIWAKYGKARLSPNERVGYAKVVDLSPKKEKEKRFTFRVMGWYKSNVGWKNFIHHNFDTKDVIEIISKNDIPEEIRKYF